MQPRRLRDALNETPTELAELQVGLAGLAFGLFLLHPNRTFDLPQYRAMAVIASEAHWGLLFAGWGLAGLLAVTFTAGRLRTLLAVLGMALWAAVSGITVYHSAGGGIILYPLEVIVCGWIVLRRLRVLA